MKSAIQQLILAAHELLGDERVTALLLTPGATVENPATETYTRAYTQQEIVGHSGGYSLREIDGVNIKLGDRKLVTVTPDALLADTQCRVTIGTETWAIVSIRRDPTGTQTTFQLRR